MNIKRLTMMVLGVLLLQMLSLQSIRANNTPLDVSFFIKITGGEEEACLFLYFTEEKAICENIDTERHSPLEIVEKILFEYDGKRFVINNIDDQQKRLINKLSNDQRPESERVYEVLVSEKKQEKVSKIKDRVAKLKEKRRKYYSSKKYATGNNNVNNIPGLSKSDTLKNCKDGCRMFFPSNPIDYKSCVSSCIH